MGKRVIGRISESVSSKTTEKNVSLVPEDAFFNVILLYLAWCKIDLMNKAAD